MSFMVLAPSADNLAWLCFFWELFFMGTSMALLGAAHLELWQHNMHVVKFMTFMSSLDIHIATAIQHHGSGATLNQKPPRLYAYRD